MREDYDISDEQFFDEIKPFDDHMNQVIDDYICDILAEYLFFKKELNVMWKGTLEAHINSCLDTLASYPRSRVDMKKLIVILAECYNTVIVNDDPLELEKF